MSMSRKDYRLLADSLSRSQRQAYLTGLPGEVEGIRRAVSDIAAVLSANNANFNKEKFLDACERRTSYEVTGLTTDNKRFKIVTDNKMHAMCINLFQGSVWRRLPGGSRQLIKRVP